MTKDTEEFSQFTDSVACREYILPRDEKSSDPKGWIRGNTKIGPVVEVTTSYLQGKYGVEISIMSVNKDNSHSWVRICHGSNKFLMNLNNNETEIPVVQLEEYTSKLVAKDFASTHGISGNVLANPVASSAAPYPQELNPWSSHMSEPIHSSTAEKNENQTPDTGSEMPVRTLSQKFSHPL